MSQLLLEPILRQMHPGAPRHPAAPRGKCAVDIGCGTEATFLKSVELPSGAAKWTSRGARRAHRQAAHAARHARRTPSIRRWRSMLATMLAVLEHLAHPDAIVREIDRVLRPAGRLVPTVLSVAVAGAGVPCVSPGYRQRGRDPRSAVLQQAVARSAVRGVGLQIETYRYFQLGMNNFLVCRKGDSVGRFRRQLKPPDRPWCTSCMSSSARLQTEERDMQKATSRRWHLPQWRSELRARESRPGRDGQVRGRGYWHQQDGKPIAAEHVTRASSPKRDRPW